MSDKTYTDWASMNDSALAGSIGEFVKHHRLKQNLTQEKVAGTADISRSTLSLLEKGKTVTIVTLLKVLRVLDLLHVMDTFRIRKEISPIDYARMAEKERRRARPKEGTNSGMEDIKW